MEQKKNQQDEQLKQQPDSVTPEQVKDLSEDELEKVSGGQNRADSMEWQAPSGYFL